MTTAPKFPKGKKIFGKERQEALLNGQLTYFTGKPCKRGHISEKLVSTYVCMECVRTVYRPDERVRYWSKESTMKDQLRARRIDAKRRGIPFTIDIDDIIMPEFCPILGIKLDYNCKAAQMSNPNKATLDKLNPSLGYVSGNVFVISWRANKLKSNITIDELEKILNYIKENTL